MIELYKDGNTMSIQTDAKDEKEFVDGISEMFGDAIESGAFFSIGEKVPSKKHIEDLTSFKDPETFKNFIFSEFLTNDWDFQFSNWLPQVIEICCKFRGYKSAVSEKRVLIAGEMSPDSKSLFARNSGRFYGNDKI